MLVSEYLDQRSLICSLGTASLENEFLFSSGGTSLEESDYPHADAKKIEEKISDRLGNAHVDSNPFYFPQHL